MRITATVFAVLEGLVALGSMSFGGSAGAADIGSTFARLSPGPFGSVAVIVIIVLLYRGSAGQWFNRAVTVPVAPEDVSNDIPAHGKSSLSTLSRSHPVPVIGSTADGASCADCGATPAAAVDFRGHRGFLIMMQFRRQPGPFCRDCGLATYRDMTADSALFGWWGMLSFAINPVTMLINLPAHAKVAALPPPIPGSARSPRDPGKPLLQRPAALGLLIPIAVAISIVAGVVIGNVTGPDAVSAGDCVTTQDGRHISSTGVELVKVGCSDPSAQAKVVARLEGTDYTFLCREYPDYNDVYVDFDGANSYVLCMQVFR